MQNGKHFNKSVIIYFLLLIVLASSNMINNLNFIDVIYVITLIFCMFKYFVIVTNKE